MKDIGELVEWQDFAAMMTGWLVWSSSAYEIYKNRNFDMFKRFVEKYPHAVTIRGDGVSSTYRRAGGAFTADGVPESRDVFFLRLVDAMGRAESIDEGASATLRRFWIIPGRAG